MLEATACMSLHIITFGLFFLFPEVNVIFEWMPVLQEEGPPSRACEWALV